MIERSSSRGERIIEATRVDCATLAEEAASGREGRVSARALRTTLDSAFRALRTRICCLKADLERVKRVFDHLPREAARAAGDHIG
jgi:hypothetical protein